MKFLFNKKRINLKKDVVFENEFLSIKKIKDLNCNNAILLVGFPGIGGIAKLVAEITINHSKMDLLYELYSDYFPSNVMINKDEIAEKPHWSLYGKKIKHKEFDCLYVFTGLLQIGNEYALNRIMPFLFDFFGELKVSKIIGAAGIGLDVVKESYEMFVTSNSKEELNFVKKKLGLKTKLFGYVSQITGLNGVILQAPIKAVSFVVETYGMPFYVGLKETKNVIQAINKCYDLSLPFEPLDEEIKRVEEQIRMVKESFKTQKQDISYIG